MAAGLTPGAPMAQGATTWHDLRDRLTGDGRRSSAQPTVRGIDGDFG
jgi:hypothetical protein